MKAMAQDLMDRFAVLESEQIPEATVRRDADGASSTLRAWSMEKGRRSSALIVSEAATMCQEVQDEVEEVSSGKSYLVDEPSMSMTSLGELGTAPGTNTPVPAWPWVS